MPAEVVPKTGSMPRRARHLIPMGLPRRGEAIAAFAVLVILAHLLLAQLTLAFAVAFATVSRLSRWRLWWLAVPAAAGLAWTLAIGPEHAAAGFAAGPARILGYLGGGHLLARLSRPSAAFNGVARSLPGQLPIALISGAAEAAVAGWLDWLHAGEPAARPPRPGALAAARRAAVTRLIRSGNVLTREGCALGVVPATGDVAELRWPELAGGLLVAGGAAQEVVITSLQVVHAALRRRKPLIVVDCAGGAGIASALRAACQATGMRLRLAAGAGASLGEVVRDRSAVLLTADSAADAEHAAAAVAAAGADLRRIGADGDGLVWLPRADLIGAPALASLIRDGGRAGLPVLAGAASPAAVAELAGLFTTVLAHRLADQDLAAALATRVKTAAIPAGRAVLARTLLSLGPAEFVMMTTAGGRAAVTLGRLVPARLPPAPPAAAAPAGPGDPGGAGTAGGWP